MQVVTQSVSLLSLPETKSLNAEKYALLLVTLSSLWDSFLEGGMSFELYSIVLLVMWFVSCEARVANSAKVT